MRIVFKFLKVFSSSSSLHTHSLFLFPLIPVVRGESLLLIFHIYLADAKKDLSSSALDGVGQFLILTIFCFASVSIPSSLTMRPRKLTLGLKNSHIYWASFRLRSFDLVNTLSIFSR